MGAKDVADKLISSNKVAIFSKSWCPHCRQSKDTLGALDLGDDISILELDLEEGGNEIQDYLASKTGQRTVPSIFINGNHIGGNSDLQNLKSNGQLQKLITA